MSYSLNETGSLCKRATRGAGLSWGLAEDAARGARWLSSFGLPGPRMLARRLSLLEHTAITDITPVVVGGVWQGPAGKLCPLLAGTALSDKPAVLAKAEPLYLQGIVCPLLVVPFAADAALQLEAPVGIAWESIRIATDGCRLWITGDMACLGHVECSALRCNAGADLGHAERPRAMRGDIDPETWECLSELASRICAPATEESRHRGAGSGTPEDS